MSQPRGGWSAAVCVGLLLLVSVVRAADRPLPETVNVKAFARVEAGQLELLVRVPLAAVRDVQFPTRGDAGYLDVAAVQSMLAGAARYWIAGGFPVFDRGVALPRPQVAETRIAISADQAFDAYPDARARFAAPDLSADEDVFLEQVWLDIRFLYPLASEHPAIAIDPKLAGLGVRVSTDLKYVAPDGGVRAFAFEGDPGLIYLDPSRAEAAMQFLAGGGSFVLTSGDFLVFLFCLALPFSRYRQVLPAVVAFAGGVALALLVSVSGLAPNPLWFHPLIDTLAAAAILLTAFANIAGQVTPRRRALFALCAGLVFGFVCGFHLAVRLQFAGSHPAASGLAFYAGTVVVTTGIVALAIPLIPFLFSLTRIERLEQVVFSALAADTAWGWLTDRWAQLSKIPFRLVFDTGALAPTMMGLAVLVLLGGLMWFINEWLKSHGFADEDLTPPHQRESTA